MFEFRDRVTKKIVKQVDISEEELKEKYDGLLINIFPEYDVNLHTAAFILTLEQQ